MAVLPAFIAVILLFLIPPGPDMVFMIATGLEGGRRSSAKAILGIGTGMSVYATAAVVGIGQVAAQYPVAFDAIKILGASYLLWLAIGTIRNARRSNDSHKDTVAGHPYVRGLLISLTNPKIILFYVAVLSQFLGDAQNTELQLAMLGAVNVAMEVILYGGIGMLAGTFNVRFRGSSKGAATLSYIAGFMYMMLAGFTVADTMGDGLFT